jgi:hypothetical protein
MEGIIWLFLALIVALVALGVVLAGLGRGPPQTNQKSGHCPSCRTPMSLRRVSIFESPTLRSQWLCPHCGSRMDKSGRSVSGTLE